MKIKIIEEKIIDVLVDINRRDVIRELSEGYKDTFVSVFTIEGKRVLEKAIFVSNTIPYDCKFYCCLLKFGQLFELIICTDRKEIIDDVTDRVEFEESTKSNFLKTVQKL